MVLPHQKINEGDVLVILEAMKMETEIKAARSGVVASVSVKEGDAVTVGPKTNRQQQQRLKLFNNSQV
jgi:oxaloacetate decarboxylase alpha subunit